MIIGCKTTEKDLPMRFLRTLNGIYGLTEKELELTAAIIDKYRAFKQQGLKEPFLSKFVFSTEERKTLCETLDGLSSQNLGNRFKQLIDKKVLKTTETGYMLTTMLLPSTEITFKFTVVDDESGKTV